VSPRSAELLARARESGERAHADLAQAAQRAQARREASDYAAESFDVAEAVELVATAERFVAAVERLTS
jgi:hypothetical protein